ncbi:hypothetical protein GEMMAAP_18945 [Gemmatimonas phototrophica]|uniref:Uncharacterized protein n=1 Tax=Gemmatimonas phototrophica TaxID=1379270 RepID=A0A143BML0_9BACT|nr:hypothetical protein GEMMAAP_18945 [Gemmatimonas phototrophica]
MPQRIATKFQLFSCKRCKINGNRTERRAGEAEPPLGNPSACDNPPHQTNAAHPLPSSECAALFYNPRVIRRVQFPGGTTSVTPFAASSALIARALGMNAAASVTAASSAVFAAAACFTSASLGVSHTASMLLLAVPTRPNTFVSAPAAPPPKPPPPPNPPAAGMAPTPNLARSAS